jgi:hypothetical protein
MILTRRLRGVSVLVLVSIALVACAGSTESEKEGVGQQETFSYQGENEGSSYAGAAKQAFAWVAPPEGIATSSGSFEVIPGLTDLQVCRPYLGASATASLQLEGGPAEIRVVYDAGHKEANVSPPGAVATGAVDTSESFSQVFFAPHTKAVSSLYFSVEWRALSEEEVVLNKGSLQVLFDRRPNDKKLCA